jgi:WD40 repeat protein
VTGWDKILKWKNQEQESLLLQRRLTPAAMEWKHRKEEQRRNLIDLVEPLLNWLDVKFYQLGRVVGSWKKKERWEKEKHHSRFLWHNDPRLDLLKGVLESGDSWFNRDDEEFVRSSVLRKGRNVRLGWLLTGTILSALTVLTIAAIILGFQSEQRAKIALARQLAAQSEAARNNTLPFQYFNNSLFLSHLLAMESLKQSWTLEGFQALHRGLKLLPVPKIQRNRYNQQEEIKNASFSKNGQFLAVMAKNKVSTYYLDSEEQWQEKSFIELDQEYSTIAISNDGNYIATVAHLENILYLWDAKTGNVLQVIPHNGYIWDFAFSPNNKHIATVTLNSQISIWQYKQDNKNSILGEFKTVLELKQEYTSEIDFSYDGEYLLASGKSLQGEFSEVIVWKWQESINQLQEITTITTDGHITLPTFGHSNDYLAFVNEMNNLKYASVWKLNKGSDRAREINRFPFLSPGRNIVFSPDDKYIVVGSQIWNIISRAEAARLPYNGGSIAISFSPKKFYLSAITDILKGNYYGYDTNADNFLQVWEINKHTEGVDLVHPEEYSTVDSVAFSPDGKYIATTNQVSAWIWELTFDKKPIAGPIDHEKLGPGPYRKMLLISFSPDGKYLATARSNLVWIWDWKNNNSKTAKLVARLEHESEVADFKFSQDSQYLVTASGNEAYLWSLHHRESDTERLVYRFKHDNTIISVALNQKEKQLLAATIDNTIKIWNTERYRVIRELTYPGTLRERSKFHKFPAVFSQNGKYFAIAGHIDYYDKVWVIDVVENKKILEIDDDLMYAKISFSADNRYLIGNEYDRVKIWDIFQKKEVFHIPENQEFLTTKEGMTDLDISPDGKYIALASMKKVHILLWQQDELFKEACKRLPRNLSKLEWDNYLGREIEYEKTCEGLPEGKD